MDKLTKLARHYFLSKLLMILLLSYLASFEKAMAQKNISTLFSRNDPFYRITLYQENYILPYHRLRQMIPAQPTSLDWIQPIMNTRIENRRHLDQKKGKTTLLTHNRMICRKKTVRKGLKQPLRPQNSQKRLKRRGMLISPTTLNIPRTPIKSPIPYRKHYFDDVGESSNLSINTDSNKIPSTVFENERATHTPKTPITENSPEQSPLEERISSIRAHAEAYARLAGDPTTKKAPKREEEIKEAFHQLVHIVSERPYYDYMVEEEVAFQISLKIPLFYIRKTDTRFYAAYTQRSWWQTKTSISAFFRETNFMPEVFLEQPFSTRSGWFPCIESIKLGGIHQSNGEGLEWERSWNRLYMEICCASGPFQLLIEPWWVLSTKDRATYNPDIEKYLGYWRMSLKFNHKLFQCSFQKQQSAYQLLGSIPLMPIFPSLSLTFYYFNGIGPSLSLYKDRNSSWGIGVGTRR